MRPLTQYVLSFTFTFFVLLIAIESQVDHLSVTIWTDADDIKSDHKFFNELLCNHKDIIDWNKLDIEIEFGFRVEPNWDKTDGSPWCPISRTTCDRNLIGLCVKWACTSKKQMLDFHCCHVSNKSDNPVQACLASEKVNLTLESLDECLKSGYTWQGLIQIWKDEASHLFPTFAKAVPSFLIRQVFYQDDDTGFRRQFFRTACSLYGGKELPKFCPANF